MRSQTLTSFRPIFAPKIFTFIGFIRQNQFQNNPAFPQSIKIKLNYVKRIPISSLEIFFFHRKSSFPRSSSLQRDKISLKVFSICLPLDTFTLYHCQTTDCLDTFPLALIYCTLPLRLVSFIAQHYYNNRSERWCATVRENVTNYLFKLQDSQFSKKKREEKRAFRIVLHFTTSPFSGVWQGLTTRRFALFWVHFISLFSFTSHHFHLF